MGLRLIGTEFKVEYDQSLIRPARSTRIVLICLSRLITCYFLFIRFINRTDKKSFRLGRRTMGRLQEQREGINFDNYLFMTVSNSQHRLQTELFMGF